jgi:microcystin-dependent protein
MSEPFLAEVRIMSFGFAPKGWAMCNGQLLQINQNQPLFALLGTTFGGNGQTTFALPDFRGCTPIHTGSGHTLGEKGGSQAVTLSSAQMPTHIHVMNGTTAAGTLGVAFNNLWAISQTPVYSPPANLTAINPASVTNTGGSQAHMNMQPFLTLNFCIALVGIFPSQN